MYGAFGDKHGVFLRSFTQYCDDNAELRSYLDHTAPVTSQPVAEQAVPLFVLATGRGITVAAELGETGGAGRSGARTFDDWKALAARSRGRRARATPK